MISLLQQYKRSFAWFISGLVLAILLFFGISHQQPSVAYQPNVETVYPDSEFATTHQEPNFYQ